TSLYSLASYMAEVNKALDKVVINSQQGVVTARAIERKAASAPEDFTANTSIGAGINGLSDINALAGLSTVSGNSVPVPKELISESFSIDYSASQIIPFGAVDPKNSFYHVTPFGYYQPGTDGNLSLIPRFDQSGELLLGI